MTTTTTTTYTAALSNGFTPIPFTFQAISAAEVGVLLGGTSVNTFTVTLNGDGTGTVTPTIDWGVGNDVFIYSNPNFDQPATFTRFGAFFPDQVVPPLDRLARSLLALRTSTVLVPMSAVANLAARANTVLGWDASGNVITREVGSFPQGPPGPPGAGGAEVFDIRTVGGALCDANATGTVGNDDTAAVQATINAAIAAGGGTIYIPKHTTCDGSLVFNGAHALRFVGGAQGSIYSIPPPAQLIYRGSGARFMDARSSYSINFEHIGVRYTNAAFTGYLVDFSHDTSAQDSAFMSAQDAVFAGIGVNSAAALISLDKAILGFFKNTQFRWAQVGVEGRKTNTSYSNVMLFTACEWDNCPIAGVTNAVETWTFDTCSWEGTNGGAGGMTRAYYDTTDGSGETTTGLTFINPWMGDDVGGATWIDNHLMSIQGLEIIGGLMSTVSNAYPAIKLSAAVISGRIEGVSAQGIDLANNANHQALSIKNNTLQVEVMNIPANVDLEIGPNKVWGGGAPYYSYGKVRRYYANVDFWQMGGLLGDAGVNGPGYFNWLAPAATSLFFSLTGRDTYLTRLLYRIYGVGDYWSAGIDGSRNYTINREGVGVALSFDPTSRAANFNGALTAPSVSSPGAILSSGGKLGYAAGAGGTIIQPTNKGTAVTLNKLSGAITTSNVALAANTVVTFTLNNSMIGADDFVDVWVKSGNATPGTYRCWAEGNGAGSRTICLQNISAGSLSEAIVLGFGVNQRVTS